MYVFVICMYVLIITVITYTTTTEGDLVAH